MNANYEILDERDGRLILKNKQSEQLIRLSHFEYELIGQFTRLGSVENLYRYYSSIARLTYSDLFSLINLAIQYNIISTDKMLDENVRSGKSSRIYNLFHRFLSPKSKIKPEFKGSFIVYKLFSFDVSQTWFGRGFANRSYPVFLLLIILVPFIFLLPALLHCHAVDFEAIFRTAVIQIPFSYAHLSIVIQVIMCFTWCFHEMGHYTFYKIFGGKSNEFGVGLLFYFLPIVYTSTNSVYLWESRSKRFWVSAGGILFDLILAVYALLLIIKIHVQYPTCTYVLFMVVFSIAYRTCYNLLFLLPGSDGYYIFSDLLGIERLYEKAIIRFYKVLKVYKQLKRAEIAKLSVNDYLGFLYNCLAVSLIFITRLAMLISIGFMIYNWLFLIFS